MFGRTKNKKVKPPVNSKPEPIVEIYYTDPKGKACKTSTTKDKEPKVSKDLEGTGRRVLFTKEKE